MGSVLSYFTGILGTPRIEADPDMALSNTRDVSSQHTTVASMSQNNITRYLSAFQVVQEFLDNGGSIMERQRMLESELETCHERLRRFTEDHARVSETGNENITSSNRPSTLEGRYKQFYDHERMDAIDCIESSRIKKERTKWTDVVDQYVACMIFEESCKAAQKLRESFLQGVSCILTSAPSIGSQFLAAKKTNKSASANFSISVKTDSGCQLSSLGQSSVNSLKVIMKETAETCDINAVVQTTLKALQKHLEDGAFQAYFVDFLTNKQILKYAESCCRYAWKLVCQTPPYMIQGNSFVLKSDVFDPVYHQVSREFSSAERNSGLIDFVVWPGLFEGASGRAIRKTEVILRAREHDKR